MAESYSTAATVLRRTLRPASEGEIFKVNVPSIYPLGEWPARAAVGRFESDDLQINYIRFPRWVPGKNTICVNCFVHLPMGVDPGDIAGRPHLCTAAVKKRTLVNGAEYLYVDHVLVPRSGPSEEGERIKTTHRLIVERWDPALWEHIVGAEVFEFPEPGTGKGVLLVTPVDARLAGR